MALPALSLLFNWKKIVGIVPQVFAIFTKYWKESLIVILLATIFYQNTFEKRYLFWADTIPYYKIKYEEAEKALNEAIDANKRLATAIDTTNKQIEEWKEISIKLEKDNAKLSGELAGLRQTTLNQIQDILKGPTPVGCAAAMDYLRDSIPELQYNRVKP